jgi:hypothetical protein
MTDIRARLADALREHPYALGQQRCLCGVPCWQDTHREHVADVLLSLSGIAIVDTADEATIDRVGEAIWEASVEPPDIPDHRAIARAALAAAVQAQEPK